MTTTKAELLVKDFLVNVRGAATKIAPERESELRAVFGGSAWVMDFCGGKANFVAHPGDEPSVEVRFAALLSLWCIAKAALQISQAMADALRRGQTTVAFAPGTSEYEGRMLLDLAGKLIRDPAFDWPDDAPRPYATPDHGSPEEKLNNLFLGASGWCVLHEVAHIKLGHQKFTSIDRQLQQEFEADDWATKWILDQCSEGATREFRVACCAVALAWIGIVDTIRRGNTDHPHASARLMKCAEHFGLSDISPAIEIANHILKAFFMPTDELPVSDDAKSAFEQVMFAYLRSTR